MIVFLFGLPGAGKTYLGQLLANHWSCPYWDGDEALTQEMRVAVHEERPFSEEMTRTLSNRMIESMTSLSSSHKTFVVSQAMLLETDRELFKKLFPDIRFVYIHCDKNTMLQRVASRANFVSVSYCEKLLTAFQPYEQAALQYPSVNNNNKDDTILLDELKQACTKESKNYPGNGFFNSMVLSIQSAPQKDLASSPNL
ncbi:AAA family ATPase [Legionella waltersii]|uniref:Shikimate kinase n=1 Tax=Legionella waltersii TaxID=66969 RepID=A0A0W1ABT6_9GAMM|nr:AAA family ATPase [Legionella waltersii]KTD78815.1 shikimate kinase [Legionella waltersii]SNV11001.1 shikimate kinase [Legionella waltersii]